MPKENFLIS